MTKQEEGKLRLKVYLMTAIMDLSFPGHWTATATLCIPHNSVYMPGPRAGKSAFSHVVVCYIITLINNAPSQ